MPKQELFILNGEIPQGFVIVGVEVKVDKLKNKTAPEVQAHTTQFEGKVDLEHDPAKNVWLGGVASDIGTTIRFSAIADVESNGKLDLTLNSPGRPPDTHSEPEFDGSCVTGPIPYKVGRV